MQVRGGWQYLIVGFTCFSALVAGFALKIGCPDLTGLTYPGLCYSDVTALYEGRFLASDAIPYLDFPPNGSYGDPGFFEYPVITGAVAFLAAALTDALFQYFALTAALLALVALASGLLLTRSVGIAALRWAAAPILILYAFHNWDLLAVACAVVGSILVTRGRNGWAAAWFGLGAAAKLYPALLILPLLLERLWKRDVRGAVRVTIAGGLASIAPNLVVAAANLDGWFATYSFHAQRGADLGSVWSLVLPADTTPSVVNLASGIAFGVSGLSILGFGWWRARRDGTYPTLAVGGGLVVAFLLWGKVASPQYAIWLLPSLILLRVNAVWWLVWNAVAVLVYVVSFGVGVGAYDPTMAPSMIVSVAAVRAVALAAIGVVLVRAAPVLSVRNQPPPNGRRSLRCKP